MTPDRRNRVKHGPFTTWQWAVIGAYVVAAVLAFRSDQAASRADENARRGNAAICVLVGTLENSRKTTEQLVTRNPGAPETRVRVKSVLATARLVRQLRTKVPDCREALK